MTSTSTAPLSNTGVAPFPFISLSWLITFLALSRRKSKGPASTSDATRMVVGPFSHDVDTRAAYQLESEHGGKCVSRTYGITLIVEQREAWVVEATFARKQRAATFFARYRENPYRKIVKYSKDWVACRKDLCYLAKFLLIHFHNIGER